MKMNLATLHAGKAGAIFAAKDQGTQRRGVSTADRRRSTQLWENSSLPGWGGFGGGFEMSLLTSAATEIGVGNVGVIGCGGSQSGRRGKPTPPHHGLLSEGEYDNLTN
jgi:hypothetical protein